MATIIVNDASFEETVLNSNIPVLVDFWAEWCSSCRVLSVALDELAIELGHKVKIAKVDIDQNQRTSTAFGVRSAPTMIFFKNGKPFDTRIGNMPKGRLKEWIESSC